MAIKKPQKWEPWEHENAKLKKSLPSDLIPEKQLEKEEEDCREFLLALAFMFNDIKGITTVNDVMRELFTIPGKSDKVSGHRGEQDGISLQLFVILLSKIHEALEFLSKKKKVYESDYVQSLLRNTSEQTKLTWELFNKIASREKIDDKRFSSLGELSEFLGQVRNNVGFHYQLNGRLVAGFRKFFYSDEAKKTESKKYAFRATEKSHFVGTRFYYADAALQGYYENLTENNVLGSKSSEKAIGLAALILYAISDLLIEYHKTLPSR